MLKIQDLHVYYGGIHALKGISLEVPKGKVVTLIGCNGAGKSSTLRAVSGLIKNKKGTITYNGADLSHRDPVEIVKSGIVMSPEGRRIFPHLSVLENLRLGAYSRSDEPQILKDIGWIFELFPKLKDRKDQKGGTLSGGEQQMLALGRALMSAAEVVMMDEPSLGLAPMLVKASSPPSTARARPCCWWSRTPSPPSRSPTTPTCSRWAPSSCRAPASSSSPTTACAAPISAADPRSEGVEKSRSSITRRSLRMESNKSALANALLVLVTLAGIFLVGFLIFGKPNSSLFGPQFWAKATPDEILQVLKDGNERFSAGKSAYLHCDPTRIGLAGISDQGNYAYATVLSCSDSRVPVELVFDAGVMDLFVVRVAGNVCDTDEIGSIEYGLAHVKTPVLVILGHTRCGAVTAVSQAVAGHGHPLERNIPPLVDNIIPAVQRAIDQHPEVHGEAIVPFAIEENVWQAVEDLFMKSPAVRNLVKAGKVKVVGAIYDLGTGKVEWLSQAKIGESLQRVEASPDKETEPFAQ